MKRTALITGGSRGIGYGIATALANAGYNLAINGVRGEHEVDEPLKALKQLQADVVYCQGNIGERDDRARVISKAIEHFGRIDVLVNNAGVAPAVRNDEQGHPRGPGPDLMLSKFLTLPPVARRSWRY